MNIIKVIKNKLFPKVRAIVWNIDQTQCFTYKGLLKKEKSEGYSFSSSVIVNNELQLIQILEAVYNETNIDLAYEVIK